ncbi:MAG: hypothetical protein ACYTFX_07105 [Planctomycetota bacterium]
MAIRKIKRTDKATGKIIETKSWFLFFSDHQGIQRSFSVGPDKESALSIDLWMRKLVACRQSKHYPPDIQVWIDAAPNRLKKKFVKWDLVTDAEGDGDHPEAGRSTAEPCKSDF